MTKPHPRRFLTAEWRYLLMLNFEIAPEVLLAHVPRGTELDFWNGRTFASVVGFRFLKTKLLGVPVPFHRNFDEINLRFYVRRREGDEWRRGVVFIREVVPRWMVSCVARTVYNENYVTRRMRHTVEPPTDAAPGRVTYEWKDARRWNRLSATIAGEATPAGPESEEAFIAEHYWGYTRQRDGGTAVYLVEHPPWRVWRAVATEFDCDVSGFYGPEFGTALGKKPSSAFVADGSPIVVRKGRRLE
jgi:uncharacterized protein YqjF (DUF2071 family)